GAGPIPAPTPMRGRLYRKYVALFVAVVSVALVTNGLSEIWFSYREQRALLTRIQREQAEAAADQIGSAGKEIEGQLGWSTQLAWRLTTLPDWRCDALGLMRQVPAVTELSQLDDKGREQARVSRLAMDSFLSQTDYSKDPKFVEAVAHRVYYSPVY